MHVDPLLEPRRRAMGMRLREAREARDINPRALQTELRTTYRHLLAIEEGQTRLFYSDSFYYDLFTRYALCLGFSADEAQAMVERLHEPIPPLGQAPTPGAAVVTATSPGGATDQANATTPLNAEVAPGTPEAHPADGTEPALPPEVTASGQGSLSLDVPVASAPPAALGISQATSSVKTAAGDSDAAPSHGTPSGLEGRGSAAKTPARPPARSSNTGLFVIILVGLIAFVWVITRPPEPETPVAAPASQSPASALGTAPAPTPDNAAAEAPAPATPPAPPAIPAPPTTPAPQSSTGPTPVATPAVPSAPPAPPAQSPATPSPSVPPVAPAVPAPEGAAPKVPELELTFRTKGWVWVRESNDQVREFVVQEGGTVRFQEVPIFIVLPAPDQIDAKVLGRPVSLKRTEDEKNHGRFTRTMLRQAANLGRPPSSNGN